MGRKLQRVRLEVIIPAGGCVNVTHVIRGSCAAQGWPVLPVEVGPGETELLDPGPWPHPTPPTALLSRIRGLTQSPFCLPEVTPREE